MGYGAALAAAVSILTNKQNHLVDYDLRSRLKHHNLSHFELMRIKRLHFNLKNELVVEFLTEYDIDWRIFAKDKTPVTFLLQDAINFIKKYF